MTGESTLCLLRHLTVGTRGRVRHWLGVRLRAGWREPSEPFFFAFLKVGGKYVYLIFRL